MTLPQRINVMKVVSYDVDRILDDIKYCQLANHGQELSDEDISLEEVMLWIEDWVQEDFNGDTNLIYQDENGEEL